MQSRCSVFLVVIPLLASLLGSAQNAPLQPAHKNGGDFSNVTNPDPTKVVPKDTIIVKGAWPSASDSVTPLPEGGSVDGNVFTDSYFGITYVLPENWTQKVTGPPPSDSGRYVLAQLTPLDALMSKIRGHMAIHAQDMFFDPMPVNNALQLINFQKNHLKDMKADYEVELNPTETKIGGQPFSFYAYWSPSAQMHWYVLATEIRCHTVEFVLTSTDTKLLESLIHSLDKMKLPAEASPTGGQGGGDVPVCIKDYATDANVLERVNVVFTLRRPNSVPVRIIIDKEGKVKHIHFLRAFSDQAAAITEALKQWKFRPYERDGKRVEVETGILFGARPPTVRLTTADAAKD